MILVEVMPGFSIGLDNRFPRANRVRSFLGWRTSHGGNRVQISPQATLRLACFLLQGSQTFILRVFPIPPAPALFDQVMIDVRSIRQDHISKDALVPVLAAGLNGDFLPESEG